MRKREKTIPRRGFLSESAKTLTVMAGTVISTQPQAKAAKAAVTAQSDRAEITSFAVWWNRKKNGGSIVLSLKGGDPVILPLTSLADLPGYIALLSQKPVYLFEDGTIGNDYKETKRERSYDQIPFKG